MGIKAYAVVRQECDFIVSMDSWLDAEFCGFFFSRLGAEELRREKLSEYAIDPDDEENDTRIEVREIEIND